MDCNYCEYCRLYRRILDFLINVTEKEFKNPSYETTHIMLLDYIQQDGKDYDFALVVGWLYDEVDPDGEECYQLYAKVAYQSIDSVMVEYEYDWLMPYYNDDEVWDTESSLRYLLYRR